jgi:lipid A ethanolaminephosphotransferase
MEKLKSLKPVISFHLFLNLAVVLFITGASYYHTPLQGAKDTLIYFVHLCALQTSIAGFLYVISLHRWVFRLVFSVLFLSYCCFSFWAYSQDISVTPALIHSVFETKTDIAIDVITWPYVLFFICALAILIFILKWYNRINPTQGFKILIIPAILCMVVFCVIEEKRPGSLKNRLPYNVFFGIKTYYEKPSLKLNLTAPEIISAPDSLKVVFVLGETVRADHLAINGYERNTTPKLSEEKNLISYPALYTSMTYTATSVPQILTDKNLEDSDRAVQSVYTVANAANFKTTWIANQTVEQSFLPIVETNNQQLLIDKYKSEFSFDKKRDEEMLPVLDSVLDLENRQLITLHMIGSHWWYENRYTDIHRIYQPVIDSKYIPSLTTAQLINSYDNTIVYLDYFLSEVIRRLKTEEMPTAMVYVSDHGELLGEDGKWLHAQEGDALKNPAYIIWLSDTFKEKYPDVSKTLSEEKNTAITTDIIYYRLLEILGIELQDLPKH